jgi:hypothetical protein
MPLTMNEEEILVAGRKQYRPAARTREELSQEFEGSIRVLYLPAGHKFQVPRPCGGRAPTVTTVEAKDPYASTVKTAGNPKTGFR